MVMALPLGPQAVALTAGGTVSAGGVVSIAVTVTGQLLTVLPTVAFSCRFRVPTVIEVTGVRPPGGGLPGVQVSCSSGVVTPSTSVPPDGPELPLSTSEGGTLTWHWGPTTSGGMLVLQRAAGSL